MAQSKTPIADELARVVHPTHRVPPTSAKPPRAPYLCNIALCAALGIGMADLRLFLSDPDAFFLDTNPDDVVAIVRRP